MNENMFNEEVKLKYLDKFENQDTREVYTRLFKKAYETEKGYDKDIYHFNEDELELFLRHIIMPKTKESARTYCNVLANYIQWAIDNPQISNSTKLTNPLKRRQEFFYEFVQDNKMYFSIDEKQAIMKTLINKQDSFIVDALWEGVQGTKLSELVNLRIDDVDFKHSRIILRDNEGEIVRQLQFFDEDDTTIFDNAILANKEFEYYKMNGTVDHTANVRESVLLPVRSEYVLKSAPTNSKDNEKGGQKVSYYTVYNRLEMVKKLDELVGYEDAITTKNIVRSGMIYMALKLYERDRELGRKQIEEICARYDMKYKWSLRDFLNLDMLNSLYPNDMKRITEKNTMGK